MILPVIYPSAAEFWLRADQYSRWGYAYNERTLSSPPENIRLGACAEEAADAASVLGINQPLYLSSPCASDKRHKKTCVVRVNSSPFPPDSFFYISRHGNDIFVACPELCFVQAARTLPFLELLQLGYDLCSAYYLAGEEHFPRTLCTNVSLIEDYVRRNHHLYSAEKAFSALKFIRNESNSPMETKIAILMALPEDMGGYGIPNFQMNASTELSHAAAELIGTRYLRGDFCFKKDRLILEYNSNEYHMTPDRLAADANRVTAFNKSGYKVIILTSGNFRNFPAVEGIMTAIRNELGLPAIEGFKTKRRNLVRDVMNL